jgi:GNAT superfamily N-acetyltransferase
MLTTPQFIYRLTQCPELSLGIFSRPIPSEASNAGNPKPKLVAHVVATRSPAPSVTDASMDIPPTWKERRSSLPGPDDPEPKGHQDTGGTICVHSLAVLKEHQNKGLGSILMKAYVQRIKDSKIAERVALLAHDPLIKFYVGMGFENMGDSTCTFGGGGWNNMVCLLNEADIPCRQNRPAYLR